MAKDIKPHQILPISSCLVPAKQVRSMIIENFYTTHCHTFRTVFNAMYRKYGNRILIIYLCLFLVLFSNYQGVLSIFADITLEAQMYIAVFSLVSVVVAFLIFVPRYCNKKMYQVWEFMRKCYLINIDEDFRRENENFWVLTIKETTKGNEQLAKPCGAVAIRDTTKMPPIQIENGSKFASMYNLIVDSRYRGQGFGKELVKMAVDFCKDKKYDYVVAKTEEVNFAGIGLLKSMGFQIVGYEENHKYLGLSSVVMIMKL